MTEPLRSPGGGADAPDAGSGHRDDADDLEDADDAEDADYADPDGPGPGLPPPTAVESLVGALLDAGPEVAEHVVRAAQELLLAAQAIVDAADRAVQEQKHLRARAAAEDAEPPADPGASGGSGAGAAPDPTAPPRHLDLAE